jgi:transcriptional regulator with XRE-family HTH domain
VRTESFGDLGARIAERRESLGLSRQDLARNLGTTVSWLIDLERSSWRWRNKSMIRIATVLDMPQLELAIAAGIITDLPGFPGQPEPEDIVLTDSSDTSHLRHNLHALVDSLNIEGLALVHAVASQVGVRNGVNLTTPRLLSDSHNSY